MKTKERMMRCDNCGKDFKFIESDRTITHDDLLCKDCKNKISKRLRSEYKW